MSRCPDLSLALLLPLVHWGFPSVRLPHCTLVHHRLLPLPHHVGLVFNVKHQRGQLLLPDLPLLQLCVCSFHRLGDLLQALSLGLRLLALILDRSIAVSYTHLTLPTKRIV
eukprot:TRINITY_DN10128_c0_g1_i2.p1 TRINITY_DN10128_c0_g1~~TRINITY_DN10128_c0_g1_i2.p1  ORF type:complete len:111 (+),score=1.33 TRINITY_DN10128_c0_g1_i2:110-442(+)